MTDVLWTQKEEPKTKRVNRTDEEAVPHPTAAKLFQVYTVSLRC